MHMIKKLFGGTQKYILLTVFLIVVNLTLGIVLMIQSGQSMKELIDSRMLDITNTAADMVDGDVLAWVSDKDKGTPEYEALMKT
ncbi:MAG: hypothetical protein IK093_02260, partial [Ruminiclostridium sp.]|nr:hypothetical protein [Ruminiclostridium sp.]